MAALEDVSPVQLLVDAGFRDDGTLRDALAAWHTHRGETLCTVTWGGLNIRTGPTTASSIVATYPSWTVPDFVASSHASAIR
ncbi:MAG: hypothetical protein ACRDRW_13595 [Pseudonocardiaceae bacterium]